MEAKFINPVLTSMVNVLSTMAQMVPKPGTPSLKADDVSRGVVTGVIAMNSKQANGSLAISFPKPVILEICKRMLRQEFDEVNEMTKDLTGEIANMVLGGAKALLEQQGYDFDLSLPSVLVGDTHTVKHTVNGPKIILPFVTDSGSFYVEICFQE